ncbi:MAG: hypothetical protein ACRC2B_12950, partial [Rubrivivax sp.]
MLLGEQAAGLDAHHLRVVRHHHQCLIGALGIASGGCGTGRGDCRLLACGLRGFCGGLFGGQGQGGDMAELSLGLGGAPRVSLGHSQSLGFGPGDRGLRGCGFGRRGTLRFGQGCSSPLGLGQRSGGTFGLGQCSGNTLGLSQYSGGTIRLGADRRRAFDLGGGGGSSGSMLGGESMCGRRLPACVGAPAASKDPA